MRSNSVLGLFRRLVVLRWQRLGINARLALTIGAAVLAVGAMVSTSACLFGGCPMSSGGCPYSQQEQVAPAVAPAMVVEDAVAEEADVSETEWTGCPHSRPPATR